MTERYRVLAERIEQELSALRRVVSRTKRSMALAWEHPQERDVYLDSVALNLHDFYTGLERAFKQVAEMVDESVPAGRNWHRDLLRQMAKEYPPFRPAVLSERTGKLLEEYLRFRHVVRNVYAFEFDIHRLAYLVDRLDTVFDEVRRELESFVDFLRKLLET